MDIPMDMTPDIYDLQAEAESMMTDECVITRRGAPSGPLVIDPDTGMYPPDSIDDIYTGKCSIRIPGTVSTGKVRPSAGDIASLLNAIFAIPVQSPTLVVTDRILITDSKFNPSMVGLEFEVIGLLPSTHVTKQRVAIEAVVD